MEDVNEHGFIDGEADAQVDDNEGNFLIDDMVTRQRLFREQLLHRLEQNDPTLVSIEVGDDWEMDTQFMPYGDGLEFPTSLELEWQWFGAMLGRNSYVKELVIDLGYILNPTARQFIRGLSLNRSIENLHLYSDSRQSSEKVDWFIPFLQNNQTIKTLYIRNLMGVIGYRALAFMLLNPNCNLSELKLTDTEIDDEMAIILASGLNGNETLRDLHLNWSNARWNQDITDHGLQAIFDTFPNQGFRLEKLTIDWSVISAAVVLSLSTALGLNTTIKTLVLFHSNIDTSAGWQDLCAGLVQSPDCTLESLIISHTGRFAGFAGTRMNDEIVQSLTDALAVNGSLMELGLNCNQGVTATGWDIFCTGLRNPISVLKRLNLSSNSINDQVINSLVESIMVNNLVLQELDLSVSNNVTAMGWEPLSAVLQSPNSAIEVLRLGGNSFNDHTLASYVDALVDNSKLREFQLRGNRNVTASGWDSFSAVLRNPTSVLEELYMGNNILNDQVIVSLADALAHNNKLRVLDLSNVAGLTELGMECLNQSTVQPIKHQWSLQFQPFA